MNEYKKLVNNKKGSSAQGSVNHSEVQERDHGRNMAAMHSKSGAGREPGSGKGAPGVKKHSNRVPPGGSSSSAA